MKGTALLLNKDSTVTVLEDVDKTVYEALLIDKKLAHPHYKSGEKAGTFESVYKVVWHEDAIDWDYGY